MKPNTVPGAGEAMPKITGMTLEELRNVFDGVQASHHIMTVNEWTANGSLLTGSYLWFKAEAERLSNVMQEIADEALVRRPMDDDEEWEREQILVRAKPHRRGRRTYTTTTIVEVRS